MTRKLHSLKIFNKDTASPCLFPRVFLELPSNNEATCLALLRLGKKPNRLFKAYGSVVKNAQVLWDLLNEQEGQGCLHSSGVIFKAR